jgi:mRNA interferase MazF
VRRGSVYWIDLDPAAPPEMGKTRPGVVVSNTSQNERLDSVVVVPLSTRAPEIWPLRVKLPVNELRDSYAVVPAIRQVSKARLRELVGHASAAVLERLTDAVTLYLGE